MTQPNRLSPEVTPAKTMRPSSLPSLFSRRAPRRTAQRGIVLFFALIVLVILLIGGIAVVRMTNASLLGAGNLAFRRDLTVQSDVVIAKAAQTLNTITDKSQSQIDKNYSASLLPVNAQGIPVVLLASENDFRSVGAASNDITNDTSKITIRYVIERMCKNPGGVNSGNCVQLPGSRSDGGSAERISRPKGLGSVVYRLTARVTGPRDTQAFFQTTFSGPA